MLMQIILKIILTFCIIISLFHRHKNDKLAADELTLPDTLRLPLVRLLSQSLGSKDNGEPKAIPAQERPNILQSISSYILSVAVLRGNNNDWFCKKKKEKRNKKLADGKTLPEYSTRDFCIQ